MRLNQQPPEKFVFAGHLDIQSIFATIQGEGPFAGQPATFVRLAGCNLQCPLCDTDYTSERERVAAQSVQAQVEQVTAPNKLVVITGGEPFRQNILPLVQLLLSRDYRVQIETNGTLPPPEVWPVHASIVCSPKAGKVNTELQGYVSAYKYVLRAGQVDTDGLPTRALDHPAAPRVARPHAGFHGPIYVQPCDEQDKARNQENLTACIRSAMKHGYTLCVQVHKTVGLD
jgi:7-carboxy-7-deazaguanine synthase